MDRLRCRPVDRRTRCRLDELTESQLENVDDLLTVLKYFTTGREYIKTLYFEREMANLSRGLLAISFPALVFLSFALLSPRAGSVPEVAILGIPALILFVGFTYIAGMAPYTVFSAYIFRSATIPIKMLAAGPFILETGSWSDRLDGVADDHSE